ncbi:nucleotidyltransferase domain-containing protein [Rubricoccus marinus]|uniref:Uncharacterized protein n=1 Tax=Rubricoccus marinus TaxID=716817 RepID=A0A259TY64_9BACT|nr:hypothetical protein [Rubricoccus marinus]OZC02651.1 hypothetical protein BSZ36_06485 [Rubricoccus marinus]
MWGRSIISRVGKLLSPEARTALINAGIALHMPSRRRFFRRIERLIRTDAIPCVIAGGYAYDAKRGRITRPHKDVDMLALEEDRDAIIAAFEAAGLRVKAKRSTRLVVTDRVWCWGDVFLFRDVGGGLAEIEGSDYNKIIMRVPRDVLVRRQQGRIGDRELPIPCDDYFYCMAPFIANEDDQAFCRGLPHSPSLRLHTRPAPEHPGYTLYEWGYDPVDQTTGALISEPKPEASGARG